jgi:ATP-dependent Clp protease ATP-binding subunit ClpA
MFERFTDRARRVVVLAQEEARMLDHNYIGTEHILLGLIHEGEGVAAKALTSLGISLQAVRQQVEEIIGHGQHAPTGHIPFTPRAKKVLELSLREALQLGHNYIGTEHILLGLIREGDGVAAQVLVRLGADLNRVRHQVIQLVHVAKGDRPTRIATGESLRLRAPAERWIAELQVTLARLTDRIDAIEHHLGIAEPEPATAHHPEDPATAADHAEDPATAADHPADSATAADVSDGPGDPPASSGGTAAAENG